MIIARMDVATVPKASAAIPNMGGVPFGNHCS